MGDPKRMERKIKIEEEKVKLAPRYLTGLPSWDLCLIPELGEDSSVTIETTDINEPMESGERNS